MKQKFKVGQWVTFRMVGKIVKVPKKRGKRELYGISCGGSAYPVSVFEWEMRAERARERSEG